MAKNIRAVVKVLIAILALSFPLGCARTAMRSSCISEADAASAAALERDEHKDLPGESLLRFRAATALQKCLGHNPNERTISSEQRLGEMWMYLGEVEGDRSNTQAARAALLRAKEAFFKLRRSGSLHQTVLDEVLSDSRQVDRDLAALRQSAAQR